MSSYPATLRTEDGDKVILLRSVDLRDIPAYVVGEPSGRYLYDGYKDRIYILYGPERVFVIDKDEPGYETILKKKEWSNKYPSPRVPGYEPPAITAIPDVDPSSMGTVDLRDEIYSVEDIADF